jgi:hypothetical protein
MKISIDAVNRYKRNQSIRLIRLRKHIDNIAVARTVRGNKSISAFLRKQSAAITEYDEPLIRRLMEKGKNGQGTLRGLT